MDENQFSLLEKKLDLIISLLTLSITPDKTVQERVEFLSSLGLKSTQISKILGKSTGNIDKVLTRIRKKENNNT